MSLHIVVSDLVKTFRTPVKNPEYGILRNFLRPEVVTKHAVDRISFVVERGERVAFIGPNGAGKSTTIKMMTGILHPTSGSIRVAGLDPQCDRRALAFKIGTLFGQRSQLIANLPVTDSFELFGTMYELKPSTIKRRSKELVDAFELDAFMNRPVRKLSLGERMRCEIAVSLLHKPEVIFLDEPTIGLDVVAKQSLRKVLNRMCADEGVTLFLTSHDAGDIEALCDRTIIVNHGKIIIDEQTESLRQQYFTVKHVRAELEGSAKGFSLASAKNVHVDGNAVTFTIDTTKHDVNVAIGELLKKYSIIDLDVANTELEEIIASVYAAHR